MSPDHEEEARIESELRKRVDEAEAAYRSAKAQAQQLMEAAQDTGLRNPDGTSAIVKASRIQQQATMQYSRALVAYSEFLLTRAHRK